MSDKTFWFVNSEENKKYETSTWYRCIGLQRFIQKVEKENEIVALTVDGNNIGFILNQQEKA